jgi:phage head maturation protease
MERKIFPSFAVKVDTDRGVIEHIFAVLGNVDEGSDRLHLGSFAKTIAERGRKVRVLDHHNTDSIMRAIGKPLAMRELSRSELPPDLLMMYPTATGGVLAETQFLMDTPEGKGAFIRYKEGALDEWSFGYDALDVDYTKEIIDGKEMSVRNIRTLKLYEYSPVLWGMNPATATLSAKSDKPSEGKPYGIFVNGEQHCIYKIDADGERMGESLGCHDSEDEAVAQMRAMMANEKDADTSVDKAMDEDHMAGMEALMEHMEEMMGMMREMMGGKEPEKGEKAGRRVRRDKVELLRQLSEITRELMTWADYDDAESEDEESDAQPKEKQQAGPGTPPTSQKDYARLIEIETAELDMYL